jgi:hypothetical protein
MKSFIVRTLKAARSMTETQLLKAIKQRYAYVDQKVFKNCIDSLKDREYFTKEGEMLVYVP